MVFYLHFVMIILQDSIDQLFDDRIKLASHGFTSGYKWESLSERSKVLDKTILWTWKQT